MQIFQPDRFLLAAFVAAHAKELTGNLLDVGGGNGKRYRALFPHVTTYKTLDPDLAAQPDIVGVAEQIPLPDASVDSILCTEMLMDCLHPEQAIAEMARVLKPGGTLLLSASFMGALYNEPHNFWRFTPYSLERLLQPYFSSIALERRGGYFALRTQQRVRYLIERFDLYHRPLLGRMVSLWSAVFGRLAIARDRRDDSKANRKFAIGYHLTARRA